MHSISHRLLLPFPSPAVNRTLLPPPRHPILTLTLAAASTETLIDRPDKTLKIATETETVIQDSPAAAYWDYQFLFLSQRAETRDPVPLRLVSGSLPTDFPRGTYYLTGPGLFADDHGSTVHPLDGHGYLRAFEFGEKGISYSARYIRTEAEREEREEGSGGWRFSYRGPFSVLKGGRRVGNVKVMKNVANTSVVRWGGKLMCMWEGGNPYEIEEGTLDTVGTVDLVGREGDVSVEEKKLVRGWRKGLGEIGVDIAAGFLKPILQGVFGMPPKRLLSHYKIDPKRNRLLVLSCNAEDMLLPRSNFIFYEFDSEFNLKQKKEFIIPDQLMIHDWAFTDNNYIIIGNRIKLDVPGSMGAVSGMSPMISALSVNPSQQTSPIYLLPRSSHGENGQRDWREPIEAPAQLWALHVSNAFEERDDTTGDLEIQLLVSVCSYQWFNFQKMFGYNWKTGRLDPSFMNVVESKESLLPHLVQVSIQLDKKGACHGCSIAGSSDQWNRPADFPAINAAYSGQRNSFTYAGTNSGSRRFLPHFPFDSVMKLNSSDGSVAMWSAGNRTFIGEPIYISKGEEEDDGYILVVEYAVSKQRCYLVILDARNIGGANAMVAKLEVPKHLNFPLGFHGFWSARNH
uniref:Carotenoid cleavage dioxygenase 7 n=1 Tax=Crocus sativus TaxID=82528 RepID=A0A075IEG5_CROSA|nr:carotenoid cleavage dioxygenase 7 [Crocus sativus]